MNTFSQSFVHLYLYIEDNPFNEYVDHFNDHGISKQYVTVSFKKITQWKEINQYIT